jgi:hypothetical protein
MFATKLISSSGVLLPALRTSTAGYATRKAAAKDVIKLTTRRVDTKVSKIKIEITYKPSGKTINRTPVIKKVVQKISMVDGKKAQ